MFQSRRRGARREDSIAAIRCYNHLVTFTLKARVRGGRLILDEPVDLPEGSEVELVPADEGDTLDDADRARLHAALARSAEQLRPGQGIPAEEVLRQLATRDRK